MDKLAHYTAQIEEAIEQIPSNKRPYGLYEPIKYILSLGGKRIRPVLCLIATSFFDESKIKESIPAALALEVFHNFTLLHDDIMDNSPLRRNKPTVHEKWNSNVAILSGDAMLIEAYKLVTEINEKNLLKAMQLFNQTAIEVCEGQQYDMEFEEKENITIDDYLEMVRLKTGVLIGASLKMGAIIGGASNDDAQYMYDFGVNLGISFQLQDDWLDTFGSEEDFGKPIGQDILNNKKTFLLLYALNNLKGVDYNELYEWINKKEYDSKEKIKSTIELFNKVDVSNQTKILMNDFYEKSLSSLEKVKFGNDEIYSELIDLSKKLMNRKR